MTASKPFISKRTIEYSSNCEFLLKIEHFLAFWKSLSLTKLTYTPALSSVYAPTLVLMRTSRKTHFRLWANLQITLVTITGSVLLCPLMFSWCEKCSIWGRQSFITLIGTLSYAGDLLAGIAIMTDLTYSLGTGLKWHWSLLSGSMSFSVPQVLIWLAIGWHSSAYWFADQIYCFLYVTRFRCCNI